MGGCPDGEGGKARRKLGGHRDKEVPPKNLGRKTKRRNREVRISKRLSVKGVWHGRASEGGRESRGMTNARAESVSACGGEETDREES